MQRRLGLVFIALCAVATSSCVPPEDAFVRYPKHTPLGIIQSDGIMQVGVPEDHPPFFDDSNGEAEGFFVDLARIFADRLKVELEFVPAPQGEVLSLLDSGRADIAFPLEPLTEETLREFGVSDTIFVGHQRLLSLAGAVSSLEDLAGESVCQAIDDITGIDARSLDPSIEVAAVPVEDCLGFLEQGEVAAITAPDVILLGLQSDSSGLEIVGPEINTVGYGITASLESRGVPSFLNDVLGFAIEEGMWRAAYDEWIGDKLPFEPPELTAGEAAAIWPTEE